ncbi:aminotransferase class V-fold PLP-dependent enzyme [Halovenus sp. WSH3]|uniref:Aminotransferase class V-fold PLP-dependent enzyme n=1 Tax=Halovenus carboxidivorans TaxID=2692199 RepID=A0A6B0T6J5_9EURY|nr:aminotransferase class V-fold PLP-dependent enzyme [Halovenus carboxidivorans]MXR50841.1 aminotransferase class V-fold PLP-dependent enzyme [Halovenus carboxidivorans]
MDPESLRSEIPAFEECTYLNWGASGPSPRTVVDAAAEFERYHQYDSPADEGMYEAADEATESAREAVAGLLGTRSRNVALTQSTADGINHVATSIDWQPGDVVVRTDTEHSAARLPWERMAELHDIEIRVLETTAGRLDFDELKTAVSDARLLCFNSPTWNYGTRQPVEEIVDIAHDAGARVLVDAVQAPGQQPVPVEQWGADFVAGSGHKWLLGVWGAGFLYVSDDALDALTPTRIGYYSVEEYDAEDPDFYDDARKFDLGTRSVAPFVALETAIERLESVGVDTVDQRISRLADRLKDGLGERLLSPRDAKSGLVTFSAEDAEATVERLAARDIQIRYLPDPYACRVSVHAVNTDEDIDELLDAL